MKCPSGWDNKSHNLWLSNKKNDAIKEIEEKINTDENNIGCKIFEQLGYYLYSIKDYQGASLVLEKGISKYPNEIRMIKNLRICYSKNKDFKNAISAANKVINLDPTYYLAYDGLASAYYELGDFLMASQAGNKALSLKDKKHTNNKIFNSFIHKKISSSIKEKKKVISFSLWGKNKRYLYGALRNLLLSKDIYRDWELWFYVDNSVPKKVISILKDLGGIIHLQVNNQTLKEKLCWRFKVANDKEVGYFLVRDVDSVISVREYNAVQEWINSGKSFHILRDWWTHTDLILAGLWGGVAGILPNIDLMLKNYTPEKIETVSIDQWFLRDCLWSYIKGNCLIHDRCFSHNGSINVPGINPIGDIHIGANEFAQNPELQKKILAPWIEKMGIKDKISVKIKY